MENSKDVLAFPTWEAFQEFNRLILGIGFRRIGRREMISTFSRLELKAPRPITGREAGYIFSNPFGYSVKIWTTVIVEEKRLRPVGEDVGWVIITKGDKLVYSARYFVRSGDFFLRLLKYGWIAKKKIENPPLCPCEDCKRVMHIYRKRNTRQYMWRCDNPDKHEAPMFRSWDYGLGHKAKAFLEIRREASRRHKVRNQKAGKEPVPKAKTRKKWVVGRPENLEK